MDYSGKCRAVAAGLSLERDIECSEPSCNCITMCNGSAEIGQTALLAKLVTENKDCKWIYRFWANPGMPRGGIVPPSPVLAPGSALGSRPRVALSSAQAPSM